MLCLFVSEGVNDLSNERTNEMGIMEKCGLPVERRFEAKKLKKHYHHHPSLVGRCHYCYCSQSVSQPFSQQANQLTNQSININQSTNRSTNQQNKIDSIQIKSRLNFLSLYLSLSFSLSGCIFDLISISIRFNLFEFVFD